MSSIGNTLVSLDAILKEYYRDGGVVNTTFVNNPLWALLSKKQHTIANVGGRSFVWPVKYATSQGRSAVFASAQAGGQGTSTQAVDFINEVIELQQQLQGPPPEAPEAPLMDPNMPPEMMPPDMSGMPPMEGMPMDMPPDAPPMPPISRPKLSKHPSISRVTASTKALRLPLV